MLISLAVLIVYSSHFAEAIMIALPLPSALTRWYSRVTFQGPGQEVIDGFRECFVEALRKYYEVTINVF